MSLPLGATTSSDNLTHPLASSSHARRCRVSVHSSAIWRQSLDRFAQKSMAHMIVPPDATLKNHDAEGEAFNIDS